MNTLSSIRRFGFPIATVNLPITQRALVQRLKRRHAREGETFHVTRGERWYSDLGYWHTTTNNVVRNAWLDLESLVEHARDLGVLAAHETVVDVLGERRGV